MVKDALGYDINIGDYLLYVATNQISPFRIGKVVDITPLKKSLDRYDADIRLSSTDVYTWTGKNEVKLTTIRKTNASVVLLRAPKKFEDIL